MPFEEIIEKFNNVIEKHIEAIFDKKIKEASQLDPFVKLTYSSLRNYVLKGGTRILPIMLIMAYKGAGGKNLREIVEASLSVELLHNSTLIRDDTVDEDAIRFSVSNDIVFGNMMQTMGAECLAYSSFDAGIINRALEKYNEAHRRINDSQLLDIQIELKKPSEQEYLDIINRKTGNLFVASIEIGAILGNATERQLNILRSYAENLAAAFQLKDDLVNLNFEIKKGRKTLLIVTAMEKADKNQMAAINAVLGKEDAADEDVAKVIGIIDKSGASDYVKSIAYKKAKEAKEQIKKAGLTAEGLLFFEGFSDYILEKSTIKS